jgi:Fur family ferric uptake transcriptional regulator
MESIEKSNIDILKEAKLRVTNCREDVLKVFKNKGVAITHSYIETELGNKHDRVTLYRTLHSFLKKGIIHKVLDEGGSAKYALCSNCDQYHHHDNHVHFKCNICNEIVCLEGIKIPHIDIPSSYKVSDIGILIQGTCNKCLNK